MTNEYNPKKIESKWIKYWEKQKTYKTPTKIQDKKSMYMLSMFPYPSGSGLHIGHVRIYTGTDVMARYFRMQGYPVLHPMGWDAFGLPAENAAIKEKKNPMDMVPNNIANFKRQMQSLGFSYDWDKELSTIDPNYYKWTQWLFIQFFKRGLLYKKDMPVYFCPACKTGLSEEEVLPNGTHERCNKKIIRKNLPQWIFKITKYADSLLKGLEDLDSGWPKGILAMQKNWIGKKQGINISYKVANSKETITCFTTRPDTNFGATFIVLAPEHPFVAKIQETGDRRQDIRLKEIKKYVESALAKTDLDRISEEKIKTGVFTGYYAVNSLNNRKMPIYISDFVLSDYGTGAVVGVPGHDKRDFEFAKKFNIEIIRVVVGPDGDNSPITKPEQVYEGKGKVINSDFLNGLDTDTAFQKITAYLKAHKAGKQTTSYHLRDWIFSRQRYWGEPIPMVYCEKCNWVPISESELPLKLPYLKQYEPTGTGKSPLANAKDWVNTKCPKCGKPAKRETDTMPNWAGSSWYFLHFARQNANPKKQNPNVKQISKSKTQTINQIKNKKNMFENCLPSNCRGLHSEALAKEWNLKFGNSGFLPVDWYLGGAEHAVLHLLYARFWTHILNDMGLLNFREPFKRLRSVGMVLAEDHHKMSKSLGNVISPDSIIAQYGADTLRLYEMFMAPFNIEIAWSNKALKGTHRFLSKVYQTVNNPARIAKSSKDEDKKLVIKLQTTIHKVGRDIADVKFNTAIACLMEFVNAWQKGSLTLENAKKYIKILSPFAPFLAEEIWQNVLNEKTSVHLASWPKVQKVVLDNEIVLLPIQVNGKLRALLKVNNEELKSKNTLITKALENKKITKYLANKKYQAIYVPKKILNLVVKS